MRDNDTVFKYIYVESYNYGQKQKYRVYKNTYNTLAVKTGHRLQHLNKRIIIS